jgi:hypothetical protein
MGNLPLGFGPLLLTQSLFWGLVVAGALMAVTDRYIRATIRRYSLYLLLAISGTLVWRFPTGRAFFLGTEYEDAYVYTVVARQMLEGNHVAEGTASYLTTVCDVGSLRECQSSTTYSGHYIGSSFVLSLAARVLGYRPAIAGLVGIAAACVMVVLIFFLARMLSADDVVPIFSAAVFAMTPVFAVHGIAAYAEPLSNMCVTIGFFAYLRYLYSRPNERTRLSDVAALCTWCLALLFAILVKRENLVLGFVLPFASIVRIAARRDLKTTWYRIGAASLGSGIAVAFSLLSLRFGEVLLNETAEFRRIPFGLTQVRSLLPAFLNSFGVTSWYCLGLVWVLAGLFLIRRCDYRTLYPVLVITAYLSLYVSHVRSYYQVNCGDVAPADVLRYSMNFMTMWALLAGVGLAYAVRRCRGVGDGLKWRAVGVSAALVVYGATAYRYTTTLRDEVTSEEQRTRIEPSVVASQLAVAMGSADTYVVTLEPLVLQMYGPPNVNVIELTRVNDQLIAALGSQHEHLKLLYLDNAIYRNDIDQNRYRPQLELLGRLMRESLHRSYQFEIVELQAAPL